MIKKVLAVFGNVALFGQERSNIKVFDTLKKQGCELLLLVNDRGFHWHLQPEVEAHQLSYRKIRYPWNFRKTLNPKLLWFYLRDIWLYNVQFYKEYKTYKPDYIHIANDFYFLTLSPVLFFVRCPIVFRLGDKPEMRFFYEKLVWKKVIMKKVHHFVCISKFIANQLDRIKPGIQNYSIIYNIPPSRKAIQTQETIPLKDPKWFTTVFVGQISVIKGVDLIIEAARMLFNEYPDVRFVFAGQLMYSQLFASFEKDPFFLQNKHRLLFLDKVQNTDLVYQCGDVHLAPSTYEEPLSNVVGEAKVNHRASIVFDNGGLAELVMHGGDGFVCRSKDAKGICEAILYYYQNRNLAVEHGEQAYRSMQKLGLTEENFTQKWKEVYQIP